MVTKLSQFKTFLLLEKQVYSTSQLKEIPETGIFCTVIKLSIILTGVGVISQRNTLRIRLGQKRVTIRLTGY